MLYFETFFCTFFCGITIGLLINRKQWIEGYDQARKNFNVHGYIVTKSIDLNEIIVEDKNSNWHKYKRAVD
jgi:hypothetical protein